MKIIPAGKFESALVRLVDEVVMPNRNATGHPYYMDLNRLVDRIFVDGVGTFIALAEETIVPWELDWLDLNQVADDKRIELGVDRSARRDRNDEEDNRRYDELRSLNEQICKNDILSGSTLEYITSLDLTAYPEEVIKKWNKNIRESRSVILSAYLRRLLDQIYTAPEITSSYILIAEPDIQIMGEIGNALLEGKLTTNLPFPDLRNRRLYFLNLLAITVGVPGIDAALVKLSGFEFLLRSRFFIRLQPLIEHSRRMTFVVLMAARRNIMPEWSTASGDEIYKMFNER